MQRLMRGIGLAATAALLAINCGKNGSLANISSPTTAYVQPAPPQIQTTPVNFYIAGDIADCTSQDNIVKGMRGHEYTGRLLSTLRLDGRLNILATSGDNAYFQGSLKQYMECYDPAWGRYKSSTYPSPGNHEYETPGGADYYAYYGQNAAGPPNANKGPFGLGYYSFDPDMPGNTWHIISLNSNLKGSDKKVQRDWLDHDLHRNTKPCILAYWHYPLHSSGAAGNISEMLDEGWALYNSGVDVIVAGHDHNYESFYPQSPDGRPDILGPTEFVVGAGGAPLRKRGVPKANSIVWDNTTWGLLHLSLTSGNYEWNFMPAYGNFTDSGRETCSPIDMAPMQKKFTR